MHQDNYRVIKFGTDGWRGRLAFDFTLENLIKVTVASCQELNYQYYSKILSKKVLIGFDRRFMANHLAKAIIPYVNACGLEPILSTSYVTTPACSFYAKEMNLLGSLIITASHNPSDWLGLKIKNFQGSSVNASFTEAVEQRIRLQNTIEPGSNKYEEIDIKRFYLERISSKFNTEFILNKFKEMKIKVFFDSMHGSASNSLDILFKGNGSDIVQGIRENNDPYFGGHPPEPLENYIDNLKKILKQEAINDTKTLGIVFDGDGDRIAVIDELGRYCSTQNLLPYFIAYLGLRNKTSNPVLKTVSGSDIITNISKKQNRKVIELPVGFKFIAEQMINEEIFIGGEESGGVGFGEFLPERDGLYAAMTLLNGIAEQSKYLFESLDEIQKEFGPSFYERIDLPFTDNNKKNNLKKFITNNIPNDICNYLVKNVSMTDGIKIRLENNFWILFRFSGTEPLLRLYCEAPSKDLLDKTLKWSKEFINNE